MAQLLGKAVSAMEKKVRIKGYTVSVDFWRNENEREIGARAQCPVKPCKRLYAGKGATEGRAQAELSKKLEGHIDDSHSS